MIAIYLFGIFTVVTSQPHWHSGCTNLESAYASMCPGQAKGTPIHTAQGVPGKRGPTGAKGIRGLNGEQGPKGDVGEPNYDRVEEIISRRIKEAAKVQSEKISELTKSLSDAKEEIGRVKNKTDVCPVNYDGKCFWAEISKGTINCDDAKEVCKLRGGNAANIYSEDHHYMLMGYLRMMLRQSGVNTAWLGMTYDQQNNRVLLSDGAVAPFLLWFPGHPDKSYCCCMGVHVDASISHETQHIHTFPNTATRHGVICEK